MTWQEDLRQLDARLASGDIGAADYRKTRDEILAQASSGNQANGKESPKEGLWKSANPGTQDEKATEETQVLSGETTMVMRVDSPEEEKTQVVTADQLPPSRPVGPDAPPPWAVPQPGPYQQRSAPIQGQEVFGQATSGGSGRWLRWAIPVLVVVLVAAGLWWFVFRQDDPATQAQNPPADTTTQQEPPPSEDEQQVPGIDEVAAMVPALPGEPKADSGPVTTADALEQKLLNQAYATLLTDNGASEIVYQKSARDDIGFQVIAAPVERPGSAPQLAEVMTGHLQEVGFGAAEPAESAGLPVLVRADQFFRTFVVTYSSGDIWVQLNVSAKPDADEAALRAEFDTVLATVTEALPAG